MSRTHLLFQIQTHLFEKHNLLLATSSTLMVFMTLPGQKMYYKAARNIPFAA